MTRPNRKPSQRDDEVVTIGFDPWETLWAEVVPDDVPEGRPAGNGWKTVIEVAAQNGKARSTVDAQLRQAWQRGAVERVKRRMGPNGTWVHFYRPTGAKTDFSRKVARATC